MKIVDKQRDYYDCSMGVAYDPSVLYIRSDKKKIPIKVRLDSYCGILGFCGKLYPFFYKGIVDTEYYWTTEEWSATNPYKGYHRRWWRTDKTDKEFFDNVVLGRSHTECLDYFHIYNTPIFLLCSDTKSYTADNTIYLYTNPLLRPLGFSSIKDPYTAFQEIYQYVGGVLNNQMKPMPILDDETMAEIKGFDKKWSFRKEPTK